MLITTAALTYTVTVDSGTASTTQTVELPAHGTDQVAADDDQFTVAVFLEAGEFHRVSLSILSDESAIGFYCNLPRVTRKPDTFLRYFSCGCRLFLTLFSSRTEGGSPRP